VAAFALPALLAAAWTVVAGKDLNWDLLHYHWYVAQSFVEGRSEDYFAARAESYLNPLGYLPFYWMVSAGWHSVVASVALAALHSASIGLLFLIGWELLAHRAPRERMALAGLGAMLGAATAVFWTTTGTSYLDPLLAVPMLGGVLLLAKRQESGEMRLAAVAGVLFGMAAALKYSNAFFALAGLLLAATVPTRRPALQARSVGAYMAGGAISVLVLAGPWMAAMYREFGNPVFPHLNGLFRSPAFPPFNLAASRYAPQTLPDALLFPFQLASHTSMTYVEISAPDFRFAAALICAGVLLVALLLRRGRPASATALRDVDLRLLAFFALATVLWIWTSANGRYGMLVLLLVGPCLARLLDRLLRFGTASLLVLALIGMQAVALTVAAPARWFIAEPWSKSWFPYQVPGRGPALYLTIETQPMAVVAPFLHPDSAFVNLRGQRTLAADEPRLVALLKRYEGRVRVLGRSIDAQAYERQLARIGYRLDPSDCFAIEWRRDDTDALSRAANWISPAQPAAEPLALRSCALRAAPRDPAGEAREREASALFDRVQKNCPRYFRGQTAVTEPFGTSGWARHYVDLDARLEVFGERILLNRYRAGEIVDLGPCR